jgi:hypothetical protein
VAGAVALALRLPRRSLVRNAQAFSPSSNGAWANAIQA